MKYKMMKLKELCTIKHGYAFKGENITFKETENLLVTPGNFKIGGGFKEEKCKYYESCAVIPDEYILNPLDLIVTMTDLSKNGDTLGYSAIIPEKSNKKYLHNQRIGLVSNIKTEIVLKDYLYWFMRTYKYQRSVVASSTGTTVKHTSPNRILDIEIPIYSIKEQFKISNLLNNLEKKIELNNQINNNLEEQINLIFINKFYEKIQNHDIEKFEKKCLYDVLDVIDNRGKTPKLVKYSDYPILDVRSISGDNRIIDFKNCIKYVSKETYDTFFRSGHPKINDILISTVGSLAEMKLYKENKGTVCQNVVALRSKNNYPLYSYQYLKNIKNDLISYNIGSVQPSIKVTQFMKHEIYIPEEIELLEFESMSKIYTDKMLEIKRENEALEKLRDAILPKLMNGEINLDKIEI